MRAMRDVATASGTWAIDPDYERLTGQAYSAVTYDWTRRRWVRERGIKLGRADPVSPRTGGESLVTASLYEGWEFPAGMRLRHCIAMLLTAEGPLTVADIAAATGKWKTSVKNDLVRYTELFHPVDRVYMINRPITVWGLVGVHQPSEQMLEGRPSCR